MAGLLNYFTGSTTANWGSTSSWSLGRIPTSTDLDIAYFGPISPTCSVNVNANCYNFDCSTYNRELTLNLNLNIYGTYSNFGSSAAFKFTAAYSATGSTIRYMGTCSITSNNYIFDRKNGSSFPGTILFGMSNVNNNITLLDQFDASNIVFDRTSGTPTLTINGATLSIRESLTGNININVRGTSNIQLRGTASNTTTTFVNNTNNPLTNNIYVNSPGIVNISTLSMLSNNNIFKYISGSLSITNLSIHPNNSIFTYDNSANSLLGSTTFVVNSNNNMTFSSTYPLNTTTLTINGGGGSTTTNYSILGGFSCSIFNSSNVSSNGVLTILLSPTSSYYVNNQMNILSTLTTLTTTSIKSTTSGVKVPIYVNYNATQLLFNINFTDIDASSGATILPYLNNAKLSNVNNILDLKSYYIQTNQIQFN